MNNTQHTTGTTVSNAANNPVHAMYATKKYWKSKDGGLTATQWMYQWAAGLISSAPKPKHD